MIVSIIAAFMKGSRGIGYRGALPWRLPADLARFKQLTMGHTLIMGRVTYESLQGRSLPGRRIILLTRSGMQAPEGAEFEVAGSVEAALDLAREAFDETEAFIAGGGEVYRDALRLSVVDRMYLSLVEAELPADVFFPEYDEAEWEIARQELRDPDEENPYPLTFLVLERIRAEA